MPDSPPPRAASRPFAIVVGLMVVGVLIAVFVLRVGEPAPSSAPEPVLANIVIVANPPGSSVSSEADGGVLGHTPFTLSLPKSETDLIVIVRHDGYQDRRVSVPLFSLSGRVDVKLTPIGVDAAAPPAPPANWTP
jgi:hypothetical protein